MTAPSNPVSGNPITGKRSPDKRILGWWFFDWASQPFNTLLLTFIFAPFMTDLLGSGTAAQTVWGYGVGAAGFLWRWHRPFWGRLPTGRGDGCRSSGCSRPCMWWARGGCGRRHRGM